MSQSSLFRTDRRLRPIWRFFISAALIFIALVAANLPVGFILGLLGKDANYIAALSISSLLSFPALLAVSALLTGAFERKPLASVGIGIIRPWRRELLLGVAIGTAMIGAVALVGVATGIMRFSLSLARPTEAAGAGAFFFLVLLVAATNEELMFRGYPFQRLVESLGAVGAVALLSAVFGAMHLANPGATPLSSLNTVLAGVLLSVAYLRTRMLWLPIGIHFAWNFVQSFGLGMPVSGIVIPVSFLSVELREPVIVTGGSYGAEGGLLATLVLVFGTAFLWRSKSIYTSKEARELAEGPRQSEKAAPQEFPPASETGEPGPSRAVPE
jgi:hypothetical protein